MEVEIKSDAQVMECCLCPIVKFYAMCPIVKNVPNRKKACMMHGHRGREVG